MIPSAPSFLENRNLQLLIFGGKGGVGKTTCAVASALRMSALSPDRSLLLVSTDPAHSIRDSLAGLVPPSNLTVHEIDARDCLERFHARNGPVLERIASAGTFLDDQDTHELVNLSLPGLDELMAFLEISDWVEQRAYDCIIVDTAPSGHALRLLAMPELIRSWLAVLDAMLAKRRYMRKVFTRSARGDALDAFVAAWATSTARMEKLLRDPTRCRFVPVAIAESLAVRETEAMVRQLQHGHIPISEVLVNQLHPAGRCPFCSGPTNWKGGKFNLCEPLPRWLHTASGASSCFPARFEASLTCNLSGATLLCYPRSGEFGSRRPFSRKPSKAPLYIHPREYGSF